MSRLDAVNGGRREAAFAYDPSSSGSVRRQPGQVLAFALVLIALATLALAESPGEAQIERARRLIAEAPDATTGYNELAQGHLARGRETLDPAHLDAARAALDQLALRRADDFLGLRTAAQWRLARGEYGAARQQASALRDRAPDDVLTYGLLADANMALGDYSAAEQAVQWMLDLRPGNLAGIARAGRLRELFGDLDGAEELWQRVYQQLPQSEAAERAQALVQISRLALQRQDASSAGRLAEQALALFADYPPALGALAAARHAAGKPDEARVLLARRYTLAPLAVHRYEWAMIASSADAPRLFAAFEREARGLVDAPDNCNRQLVMYYLARGKRAEALRLARLEAGRRQDVHTLTALAAALHRAGEIVPARATMRKVLAVGTRDPEIVRWAARIMPPPR